MVITSLVHRFRRVAATSMCGTCSTHRVSPRTLFESYSKPRNIRDRDIPVHAVTTEANSQVNEANVSRSHRFRCVAASSMCGTCSAHRVSPRTPFESYSKPRKRRDRDISVHAVTTEANFPRSHRFRRVAATSMCGTCSAHRVSPRTPFESYSKPRNLRDHDISVHAVTT